MATLPDIPRRDAPSAPLPYNGFGITSFVLGFVGLLFFWLIPLGIIFSAVGVLTGIIGLVLAQRRLRTGLGFAIGGTVLSLLVLAFDIDMATGGLTRWFVSLRY